MDWIVVKESNFKIAGNGLFTCVKTLKGTTFTIYMGNEKMVDNTRHYIFNAKYSYNDSCGWHSSFARRDGSRGTVVDAIDKKIDYWEYGGDLFLGTHMINNPSYSKKIGEHYIEPNFRRYSLCEVIASRDIEAGEELTVIYQEHVIIKRGGKKSRGGKKRGRVL